MTDGAAPPFPPPPPAPEPFGGRTGPPAQTGGPAFTPTPPPPPPPPALYPPAGYTAYQAAPTSVGRISPIRRIGKATMILCGITGVLGAVGAVASASVAGDADDFVNGRINEDAFNEAYLVVQLFQVLQFPFVIAAGVLTIMWMYKIGNNVRSFGRRTTFAPVLAIVSWLLPPILFVLPLLVLRELWKASDPDTTGGPDAWRASNGNPILYVWFVVYGLIPTVLAAIAIESTIRTIIEAGSVDATAESLVGSGPMAYGSAALQLVSTVVWVSFVKQLTERHTALSGER